MDCQSDWSEWSDTDLQNIQKLVEINEPQSESKQIDSTSDTMDQNQSPLQRSDQSENVTNDKIYDLQDSSQNSQITDNKQDTNENQDPLNDSQHAKNIQHTEEQDQANNRKIDGKQNKYIYIAEKIEETKGTNEITEHHVPSDESCNKYVAQSMGYSKQSHYLFNGYVSGDSSSDNTPLIVLAKNKKMRKKQSALKRVTRKLKQGAVKRLLKSKLSFKSYPLKDKKNHEEHAGNQRQAQYHFRKRSSLNKEINIHYSDLSDDTGDELYKPSKKDINSSDSEMISEKESESSSDTEPLINIKLAKPKQKRDKNWKRKGKSIRMNPGMKRRIVHATNHQQAKKDHRSGPWKITEKTQKPDAVSSNITDAVKISRKAELNRKIVRQYHTLRLDNLLLSNGLKRIPVQADGNCFLSAVLNHLSKNANVNDVEELRRTLVEHMHSEKAHYKNFISFDNEMTPNEKDKKFDDLLKDLSVNGHWNIALADLMPLAIANYYKQPIRIYSSMVSNSVYDIFPDLQNVDNSVECIKVALFAITGQEHYDAVERLDQISSTPSQSKPANACSTPVSDHVRTPVSSKRKRGHSVTPRKRANFKSPIKKQLFRKKKRNEEDWKRNVRKLNRAHGLAYTGLTGRKRDQRNMNYRDCSKCRFSCSIKITEDQANKIFNTYYQLGSYEKQRNFICQHVQQSESKRCSTKRKEHSNAYFLTIEGKKERVCKAFFLCILNIGKKTIEYALKKKEHGVFVGTDGRGKTPSINRTPEVDRHFVREHIKSFPTVSSHYTRKDSHRLYLNSDLSIRKMHYLYEKECAKKGKKPCKENVYREIFCKEFNLSFHQPKKDQCTLCTIYYAKKQRDEHTNEDEKQFEQHQRNKEASREEKKKDKERAKSDKSFAAVTFDLEAVLPTPCTMIGDLFYKRCLSTYNLSFYSLGDSKGTCFLWDETNGGRGSSDIGSCIIMHINSVAEKNSAIREITYYSDTCGGQNRNQFVSSAMLYALHSHAHLDIINHKFFERGHSEMESDAIHSSIERAKKSTKVYHPSQWNTVVSMARRQNPYIVIPLNYRDFYDLKALKQDMNMNLKKTVTGNSINWLKVKWIKVTKDCPDSIFFNYSFDQDNFMETKFRPGSLRGRKKQIENIKLSALYDSKLQISTSKKADLLSLCKSGVIPQKYHEYYENIPVGKSIKDTLPEPDVTEENEFDN